MRFLSALLPLVLSLSGALAVGPAARAHPRRQDVAQDYHLHRRADALSASNATEAHRLQKRDYTRRTYLQSPSDFYNFFSFSTAADPSGGVVQYVDLGTAQSKGMVGSGANGGFRFGVDTSGYESPRQSVRMESNGQYGYGVYIWDLAHAPDGCATWPALWLTTATNWPYGGEIDVFEGVNGVAPDQSTLHTGPGCTKATDSSQTGTNLQPYDCNVANGANGNAGCGVLMSNDNSFGAGLNNNGGGVFALQYESSGVFVWFWPHGSAPAGTTAGSSSGIDVGSWGTPQASFPFYGGCESNELDTSMIITQNIDFCGGFVTSRLGSCGSKFTDNNSCASYVANNPGAFGEAYFDINAFSIWQQ